MKKETKPKKKAKQGRREEKIMIYCQGRREEKIMIYCQSRREEKRRL